MATRRGLDVPLVQDKGLDVLHLHAPRAGGGGLPLRAAFDQSSKGENPLQLAGPYILYCSHSIQQRYIKKKIYKLQSGMKFDVKLLREF